MKNLITLIKHFLKDHNIYMGILAETSFVLGLSLIGFLICLALQRLVL